MVVILSRGDELNFKRHLKNHYFFYSRDDVWRHAMEKPCITGPLESTGTREFPW